MRAPVDVARLEEFSGGTAPGLRTLIGSPPITTSRILIIDGSSRVTALYGLTLRNAGHTVQEAHEGEAGLSALATFEPELVLLDLALPKTSGIEVRVSIRQNPQWAALPVIVFSNGYRTERLQQVRDAGASQVLSKAASTPRLVNATVHAALAGMPAGRREA